MHVDRHAGVCEDWKAREIGPRGCKQFCPYRRRRSLVRAGHRRIASDAAIRLPDSRGASRRRGGSMSLQSSLSAQSASRTRRGYPKDGSQHWQAIRRWPVLARTSDLLLVRAELLAPPRPDLPGFPVLADSGMAVDVHTDGNGCASMCSDVGTKIRLVPSGVFSGSPACSRLLTLAEGHGLVRPSIHEHPTLAFIVVRGPQQVLRTLSSLDNAKHLIAVLDAAGEP